MHVSLRELTWGNLHGLMLTYCSHFEESTNPVSCLYLRPGRSVNLLSHVSNPLDLYFCCPHFFNIYFNNQYIQIRKALLHTLTILYIFYVVQDNIPLHTTRFSDCSITVMMSIISIELEKTPLFSFLHLKCYLRLSHRHSGHAWKDYMSI